MSLTHASDGTTVLVGPVVDQAALHGLLQKLRDLGITLISVNEDGIDPPIVRDDPSELCESNDKEIDMTDTARMTGTNGVPTDAWRKLALAGGILYLMTFIFSIPAVFLYGPVLSDPAYILSAGADSQVLLGALFDIITALACIGTAVALYPMIKRQSEAASIGFVATRIFEAAVIVIGVVCLMAVVRVAADWRSRRDRRIRLGRRGPGPRRGPRCDVPGRPRRHARLQRAAARLRAVPVAPRAAGDSRDGPHRCPGVPRLRDPVHPWPARAGFGIAADRAAADLRVGAVARPLADLQGLQARGRGRASR